MIAVEGAPTDIQHPS